MVKRLPSYLFRGKSLSSNVVNAIHSFLKKIMEETKAIESIQ